MSVANENRKLLLANRFGMRRSRVKSRYFYSTIGLGEAQNKLTITNYLLSKIGGCELPLIYPW